MSIEQDPSGSESTPPAVSEPVAASGSFRRPADYYSQPPVENPGCPKWLPVTCGVSGCLLVVVMFIGGAFLMSGSGSPRFMGWFIGRLGSDLRPIMTSEVTPEQKKEFELLLERMESDARSGRIKFIQLGPWLEITRDAMGDRKITPQEVDEINLATDKLLSSIRKRSAAPGVK